MTPVDFRIASNSQLDRELFLKLWKGFLKDHYEAGSHIPPNDHNLLEFLKIHDCYTSGSLFGMTIFGETPEGKLACGTLVGEDPQNWSFQADDISGRVGNIWGVYVFPEFRGERLAWRLQDWGVDRLLEYGFSAVRAGVLMGYAPGEKNAFEYGNKRRHTTMLSDLRVLKELRDGKL